MNEVIYYNIVKIKKNKISNKYYFDFYIIENNQILNYNNYLYKYIKNICKIENNKIVIKCLGIEPIFIIKRELKNNIKFFNICNY